MRDAYEKFDVGFRLSHAALLRNLDRFLELASDEREPRAAHLGEFVALYVELADVHQLGEDEFFFPAFRRGTKGKSADVGDLERWTGEHRDIDHAVRALAVVAPRLDEPLRERRTELRAISSDLRTLLVPHHASEEAILCPERVRTMISEAELDATQRAIGKRVGARSLRVGWLLLHSLTPSEQRELYGDAPWLVRKVLFRAFAERRMGRFSSLVIEPSLTI